IAGVALTLLLWTLVGSGTQWRWLGAPAVLLLLGIFTSGVTVAISPFELGFIPVQGRDHYIAINSILAGLASGSATLGAGHLLHGLAGANLRLAGLALDHYQLLFALASLLLLVPLLVQRSLPEEGVLSARDEVPRGVQRRLADARRRRNSLGKT